MLLFTFFLSYQFKINLAYQVYLAAAFFAFALVGMSVAHALEGGSWLSGLYRGHWLGFSWPASVALSSWVS